MTAREEHVIVNDPEQLKQVYEEHKNDIWVGYNSRQYDQHILKAILLDFNPKELNDWIIVEDRPAFQFSNLLYKILLNNYDVMPNPPIGLKTLEGFMGNDIKETSVPFDIDRKLTPAEIAETIKYCRHDVEQTVEVFLERQSEFDAMMGICKAFKLPLSDIGKTEAKITAKVLDCVKTNWDDEFDYRFLPCLQLKKYAHVQRWFEDLKKGATSDIYKESLEVIVAGVPHVFGFGGIHGASDKPIHRKGCILHVDVGSYYPSMLIAWDLVTRAARKPEMYKYIYDTRMELKHQGKKKEQAPYKKLLNAMSGAMKDPLNPAFDPCMNNTMCINGQLMLLDLIEHLEVVDGFELIQSNTDGLIIKIPDTDEAFNQVDDICYEWEQRCSTDKCSILLELDTIDEIYQKDVNNYIWIDHVTDKVERKGAYVKELSRIDADLPIINTALVNYFTQKIPVSRTINECDDLIQFQKLVKLSNKYKWVEWNGQKFTFKSYRVFASKSRTGKIYKCRTESNPAKFGNTPDDCFIVNDDIKGAKCPSNLDKQWYINLAERRLKDFGI